MCEGGEEPDMYTSRKARLWEENFHSDRKPSVPRLKERIGGTEGVCEKMEVAWRIVPSPPRVAVRSVFPGRVLVLMLGEGGDESRGDNMGMAV